MKKQAIVVGSGAGGAAAAETLQGAFDVIVVEQGGVFRPFAGSTRFWEAVKKTRLLVDERMIEWVFPSMNVQKAIGGMVLVRGVGLGGTTTISTGNAVRADDGLARIGIDCDDEFRWVKEHVPMVMQDPSSWKPVTRQLFEACRHLGLSAEPMPKMGDYGHCLQCGRCVFGCPHNVRWDSRRLLARAESRGARVLSGTKVIRVLKEGGRAVGVVAARGPIRRKIRADVVVLSAGGLGTPPLLQRSGISCRFALFVDPVLCVAGPCRDAGQDQEVQMPFVVREPRFILSPYFDWLSFFFNRTWKVPAKDLVGVMVKLADQNIGSFRRRRVDKQLSLTDRLEMEWGTGMAARILEEFGVPRKDQFLGTVNAGHPGGMLPLTSQDVRTLQPGGLPKNVYVADSTLFPESLGNPPILTILALSRKVGLEIIRRWA
jgi:choline dehydrogenase-like flavoprotein